MTKVEIIKAGERIVQDITSYVSQPTSPVTAQPINVGLVEISQSQPTELIPGPVGPQGSRGSQWTTGSGAPSGSAQTGDMYLDDATGDIWTWDGTAWVNTGTDIEGPTGPSGATGAAGPPNVLNIGTVTTVTPGGPATASITGTTPAQTLNMGIPSGLQGVQGVQGIQGNPGTAGAAGAAGPANSLAIGTVTTVPVGGAATSTITGTPPSQTLNLGLPTGATGSQGIQGIKGDTGNTGSTGSTGAPGPANTLAIGTVTTVAPGGSATSTITGTSPNQTLNLGIPRGDAGATGSTGSTGSQGPAGPGVAAGGTTGQALTKIDATNYNTTWSTIVGGATIADTFPGSPTNGQLHWESDTGILWVYFTDANSSQWVQAGGTYAPVGTAQTRSRVVNGGMSISQETTASVASGGYPVDQFLMSSAIATVVAQQQPTSGPDGLAAVATSLTTAKSSLAAGDVWHVNQPIEGTRVKDFRWGTANARQVILRFWAYSNQAGTYSVYLKNHLNDRCFMAAFTLAASTYKEISIVVPGDTTGTWLTDTSKALTVGWGLAAGSTYNIGVAGWQGASYIQMAGQTNLAQTANNAFYLTNVGLYLDPQNTGVASAWQMPDEAEELRACQRYWQVTYVVNDVNAATGVTVATHVNFKPVMRIGPAVSFVATTFATTNVSGLAVTSSSGTPLVSTSAYISGSITTTGRAYFYGNVTANARM